MSDEEKGKCTEEAEAEPEADEPADEGPAEPAQDEEKAPE